MRRRNGPGSYPDNCPLCGCPCLVTHTLGGQTIIRWAYENLHVILEDRAVLSRLCAKYIPAEELTALRTLEDPRAASVAKWLEETHGVIETDDEPSDALPEVSDVLGDLLDEVDR